MQPDSGLVDSFTDRQLDRVTRVVAQVFDVPVVMVTVIEHGRFWIKSGVGIGATSVDRDPGLCDEVISTGRLVYHEDARKDPVACNHPLVAGDQKAVFYAGAPVRDAAGRVMGTLCLVDHEPRRFSSRESEMLEDFADWIMDLLERRRAERERDVSRRRLDVLASNPALMLVEVDHSGVIEDITPSVERAMGYAPREVVGEHFLGYVHAECQQEIFETFKSVVEGKSVQSSSRFIHKDGSIRTLEYAASPTETAAGQVHCMAVLIDLSERLHAESRVAIAEERYRKMFESSRDGMAVLSLTGAILEVNGTFAKMFGYSKLALQKMKFSELRARDLTPAEIDAHRETLFERGFTPEYEREFRRADGSLIPISVAAWVLRDDRDQPLALLTRVRDITAQKTIDSILAQQREELERQVTMRTQELEDSLTRLRRAERLASVGTLASGLAHQINNPIGSILNASEYALICEEDADAREVWRSALREAVEQSKRCGRIVRSMLQYSRGEPTERWIEDMDVVIRRALNATRAHATASSATIDYSPFDEPVPVMMNPIEMEQVVVNVVDNAIESNPLGASISLRLEIRDAQACIAVADDGRGISPEDAARIFDPFFTTRQEEGGTGLGMSVATGIVNEFGGTIACEARPSGGTLVKIRLPLAESSVSVD